MSWLSPFPVSSPTIQPLARYALATLAFPFVKSCSCFRASAPTTAVSLPPTHSKDFTGPAASHSAPIISHSSFYLSSTYSASTTCQELFKKGLKTLVKTVNRRDSCTQAVCWLPNLKDSTRDPAPTTHGFYSISFFH